MLYYISCIAVYSIYETDLGVNLAGWNDHVTITLTFHIDCITPSNSQLDQVPISHCNPHILHSTPVAVQLQLGVVRL